jgi:hypothetical protein
MHKSYSGAGRTQGTSRPRGQTPGAAANSPRCHPNWVSLANDETRGGEAGETACGSEASNDQRHRHPRTNAKLRRVQIPGASPENSKLSGQVARTASAAGPVRAPPRNRTRMTRAGGVSKRQAPQATETQGAKNRKGESDRAGVAQTEPTPQRDGPEAGILRTVRRDRRTLKGTSPNLTRGVRRDCPRRRAGGPPAGRSRRKGAEAGAGR